MKKLTVSVILFFPFITQSMASDVICKSDDFPTYSLAFSSFEKKSGRKAAFYYQNDGMFTKELRVLTNGKAQEKTIYNGRYVNLTIDYSCSHTSLEILKQLKQLWLSGATGCLRAC